MRRHGREWIEKIGHREYVGGYWDLMGQRQFHFMLQQGLRPDSVFLDLGCGALRAGRYFIQYLESGHYLGLEKEELLIERGLTELGGCSKQFILEANDQFNFQKFPKRPDFVLAHSVFTHLTLDQMELCLKNLRAFIKPTGKLFATYFDGPYSKFNLHTSHDHYAFYYTFEEIEGLATKHSWRVSGLGKTYLNRGQKMLEFLPV